MNHRTGSSCLRLTRVAFLNALLSGCALLWLTADHAQAQTNISAAHSRSLQFVVRSEGARRSTLNVTNTSHIRLEPTLVAISCERIKTVLLRELEAADAWRGKIFIALYPARVPNDAIGLTSQRFRDGWQYQVELPDVVEKSAYVRALTQALLLEIANRGATDRSAEVPTWLVEGMTEQLLALNELQIILQPPKTLANGLPVTWTYLDAVREQPIQRAYKQLGSRSPLSFEQLSWPEPDQLSGESGLVYRASAQLLVHQLLSVNGGRANLCAFLAYLPQHYNWQLAFLKTFRKQFTRPLDVEKWWELQVSLFVGRDTMLMWTPEESWSKLESCLQAPVHLRTATNELPVPSSATLQTIVRDWDAGLQMQTLETKIRELQALRLRLARNFVPLADAYRVLIEDYVQQRMRMSFSKPSRTVNAVRRLTQETIGQLDLLDARREALRAPPQAQSVTPLSAGPVAPPR